MWKKLNKHIRKLMKLIRKRKYYDFHGLAMKDPSKLGNYFKMCALSRTESNSSFGFVAGQIGCQ